MKEETSEQQDFQRELQAALPAREAAADDPRVRARLDAFRARLPRHAYVRRLNSRARRILRGCRMTVRYALFAAIAFIGLASLSTAGRSMLSEQAQRWFDMSDELGKLQILGRWQDYNAAATQADSLPPVSVADATFDRLIGLSPDGQSVIAKVEKREYTNAMEQSSTSSIWSIALETGKITRIQDGKLLAAEQGHAYAEGNRLQTMVYFTRVEAWKMKAESKHMDGLPQDELWLYDFKAAPRRIAQSPLANRWYALSPNGNKLFYHRANSETVVEDLASGAKYTWTKDRSGIAIGWAPDSGSIVTIDLRNGSEITAFHRVSPDGSTVYESMATDLGNRGQLGDCEFAGDNQFTVRTRDRQYFTEAHEDWTDVVSIQPLRKLARFTGNGMLSRAGGAYGVMQKIGEEGVYLPSFGIYDLASGALRSLDLSGQNVSIIAPSSWYVVDKSASLSPQGTYLPIYTAPLGFALIDLKNAALCHVLPDIKPFSIYWSPDGTRLAIMARQKGEKDADGWLLDLRSGATKRLGTGNRLPIAWSDDQHIIWLNNKRQPFEIAVQSEWLRAANCARWLFTNET
jgi:hypothetical protein